ncbi:MAG: formimidoylglutamate deiminase [Rhodobacterales bacterium]|nr:formimidoylglutamate deiminase [Rhodobacterales bacterium]
MQVINAREALLPDGWHKDVQIEIGPDGRVASITTNTNLNGRVIDLVLPAPVNLHSHAFQRAMSGLTEARGPDASDSFWTWRTLMYRFLDQLDPDQIEAIAALVFMEMLEAGYAGVCEFHYLHHAIAGAHYDSKSELSERVISAAQRAGIGLTLVPVLYQFGGCDARPLKGGQRRFGNTPDQFQRVFEGAKMALGHAPDDYAIATSAHSLRAVDQSGLTFAAALAPERPFHMHLAEQHAEVDEVMAHWGARPVQWLLDNHAVDGRWCLIHCTQMTAQEARDLAGSGAIAGLCPITESNLGDGIFNGVDYLGAGGKIGVGSDSNVHISLFEELKTLEYSQRLRDNSRASLANADRSSGRRIYEDALIGGAQAAGRNSGAIKVGMQADLVGLAGDNHWLCNRAGDTALDTLIFGGHGQDCITDVWSAGRHMVREGRHIARDAITRDFVKVVTALVATG